MGVKNNVRIKYGCLCIIFSLLNSFQLANSRFLQRSMRQVRIAVLKFV